jgi:hypothetical protein
MEFAFDARTKQLRAALVDFMHTWVYPAEPVFAAQLAQSPDQCARTVCRCWPNCVPRVGRATNTDHWLMSMNRLQQRIAAAALQDRGEDPA